MSRSGVWKLLVAGGGTGGHVFPGVAVAQAAKRLGAETLFVGRRGGPEEKWLQDVRLPFRGLPASGMPRNLWPKPWFRFAANQAMGLVGAWGVLSDFKPDVVFSTGGYASASVSVAAALRGIPVILLEPNVRPGLAARFLAPFAKRVATGFEETQKSFSKGKVVWTGIPVREEILAATREKSLAAFGLREGAATVLLLGGSQGSRGLNTVLVEAVRFMGEGVQPAQFIFMTGRNDFQEMTDRLEKCPLKVVTRPFIANIHEAYAAADLVVGRSGAMTCAETAARGLAAVFVPYPYAEKHQEANAKALEKVGAAVVIDQKEAAEGKLLETLIALVNDREKLSAMGEASKKLGKPEAAETLAAMLKGLSESKGAQ
jgi:UDP-N-acetylglucosamine--N-acetylmuramyl-(pentapeptide) pyrophosphoryl-undecaprenol N-acetylglucosamine transferase